MQDLLLLKCDINAQLYRTVIYIAPVRTDSSKVIPTKQLKTKIEPNQGRPVRVSMMRKCRGWTLLNRTIFKHWQN